MRNFCLVFILFVCPVMVNSQCVNSDFNLALTACLNETLILNNLSVSGSSKWDYCSGDLNEIPTAHQAFTLTGVVGRPGIELVKEGSTWYGFVTGTWTNSLYRLVFANGTNNAPTFIESFGTLSGKLNGPGQIRIVSENNSWYGIIHNAGSGELLKLSFGNSLSNAFSTTVLMSGIGLSSYNTGIALGRDQVNGWTCVVSLSSNDFAIIRLGNNLTTPTPSDIIQSSSVPITNNLGDLDLVYNCGNWYGFANNYGSGHVFRLDFGTNLFSNPTITTIANLPVANLGRLRMTKEGEEYFLMLTSLDGIFHKLKFGNDLTSIPIIVNEGNINNVLPLNTYGLALAKENSVWTILVADASNGKIYQIDYPNNCSASPLSSTQTNPKVSFSQAGVYHVSLETTNATGTTAKTKTITVSASTAPDIDFATQNVCVNNNVNFTTANLTNNITNYAWSFGDATTSMATNPAHSYSTVNTFNVSLSVTASNGCSNFVEKSLQIFNEPLADFGLPTANPFCTNQYYLFTNSSTFDLASNPSWQWNVNGTDVATSLNLSQTFINTAPQQIKLTASIPGCSSQAIQIISSLMPGPLVDFNSPLTGCQGTQQPFTNTTSGTVTAYSWNFGDGNTSSSQNPSNIFTNPGSFSITLQANNAAGCQNSKTKNVIIYSKPQPNFSIGLPPFSCTGSPSQFTDLTPVPTDSNITGWTWVFGDATNATSILKNPAYTYSAANNYNVSLTVTSNFGCINTIQKPVTIAQSPVSAFTNTPACTNQGTQFTDASIGNIKSRLWQVQSNTFTTPVVQYVFGSSGTFPVSLIITGNNSCVSQFTKNMIVPVIPTLDFSVLAPCANNQSTFSEITSGSDQAVTQLWNFGNLANGAGNPVQYAFTIPGIYSVRLSSTRQSGCVYSLAKNVSISQSPVADFTSSVQAGAAPLSISFTNASLGASTYLWKFMDQNNSTSTQVSPSFVFTDLGDYSVELNAFNGLGCANRINKVIRVLIPKIDAVMNDFYFVKDDATGTLQAVVSVLNKSNLPIIDPSILLDFSDGALVKKKIKGTIQPDQVLTEMLDFQLVPRGAKYACAEVSVLDDINSFDNKKCLTLSGEEILFSPYPNPAQAELKMDWVSVDGEPVTILITNSTGAIVYKQVLDSVIIGLNRLIINTSELSSGIFFIRFRDNRATQSFSFAVSGN